MTGSPSMESAEESQYSQTIDGKNEDTVSEQWSSADYTFDGTLDWHGRPALRSETGRWNSAKYIIWQQVFSNLAYYGVSTNLVMYLTTVMHQGNADASNFVSNWTGASYIAPLLGAFLADSFWGRYMSTLVFSIIFTVGMIMVALAAYVPSMYPPQCPSEDSLCKNATVAQASFLMIGLYIISITSGAFQSPVTALGADQFDEHHDVEKKQKSSFFNWFYQAMTVGKLVAAVAIVTIQQDVSWGLGMTLSAGTGFVALVFLMAGEQSYRRHKPVDNALARICQVFVAAVRNRQSNCTDTTQLYEIEDMEGSTERRKILHTDAYTFLDKAAVIQTEKIDSAALGQKRVNGPWQLCTVTQVEEVKRLIHFGPVFFTNVIYTTVYMQLSTLFVLQGATMDTKVFDFNIAPASLSVIENATVVFSVVIYDKFLVPFVRKYTHHPRGLTDLQRTGIGLGISVLAMVVAALVEMKRLSLAKEHGLLDDMNTPIPMSVLWEIPQYFIIGVSEVFTYIGVLEFFYDQSPDALRSIGSALNLLTNAGGSYVSTLLVTVVNSATSRGSNSKWIPDINLNRGHVDRFYWLLAGLSLLNCVAFVFCAKIYRPLQQESLLDKKDIKLCMP